MCAQFSLLVFGQYFSDYFCCQCSEVRVYATLAIFARRVRTSMAAVAARSCRRGLSQILSNGGLSASIPKRVEGLSESSLKMQRLHSGQISYLAVYRRRRGCGATTFRRLPNHKRCFCC